MKTLKYKLASIGCLAGLSIFLYLLVSFFLKSDYPLYHHSFDTKVAYDVLKDGLTLIAPFAITAIVFFTWYDQKSKEVIAIEAKNLVKGLLSEKDLLEKIITQKFKYKDSLHEVLEEFEQNARSNKKSALYLRECLIDKELNSYLSSYIAQNLKFLGFIRGQSGITVSPLRLRQQILNSKDAVDHYREKVINQTIEAIKPYSLYRNLF